MERSSVPWENVSLDAAYHLLEEALAFRIKRNTEQLFTTSADPETLCALYITGLPKEDQQHYTCHSCFKFIKKYGGLVTIGEDGTTTPFIWAFQDVPPVLRESINALCMDVGLRKVTGVFRWGAGDWGIPNNLDPKRPGVSWSHLHGHPEFCHERKDKTPFEQMAELKEDFKILRQSLNDYPIKVASEALRVLTSDTLVRAEKAEGVARWFLEVHQNLAKSTKHKGSQSNILWRAVATAPPGYAHIRTTVISTLMDDILHGVPFDKVAEKWAKKMHGLNYQRPKKEVSAGMIDAAEKKVKELGYERSFLRRYATLNDILSKLWTPSSPPPDVPSSEGVFGALKDKTEEVKSLNLPPVTLTWRKFSEEILSKALEIDILVPTHGNFSGFTAATDPDAPAILQWDGLKDQARNTVSSYCYIMGSLAKQWGLESGWNKVTSICNPPHHWQRPDLFKHHTEGVYFTILGARDTKNNFLGLFPETLRTELRDVRHVIERFNNVSQLTGYEEASACGMSFLRESETAISLRVKSTEGVSQYRIDRWD